MDSTPQQPEPENDEWLLSPTEPTAEQPTEVLDSETARPTDVTPRQGRSQLVTAGGLVAAGLVAGVVGTFAVGHHGSSTTTFQPASNALQQGVPGQGTQGFGGPLGAGPMGAGPMGAGPMGAGPMGGGPAGGPPGTGLSGEEHVQGTVAGVSGSTLRVKTASGTTSYPIGAGTQVVRNGQLAKLSELKKGDPVVVHVITSNGATVVERVVAGTMAQGFPGGVAPGGPVT